MRIAMAAVLALVGAVVPLLLFDGGERVWAYRGYAALVAVVAARSFLRRVDESHVVLVGDASLAADDGDRRGGPFARPRGLPSSLQARAASAAKLARHALRRAGPPLPRLQGTATIVFGATSTAGAAHHRLRPILREIADERLRARHDTSLAATDGRAAEVLGPEAWAWLRPGQQPPDDRLAPGMSIDELEAIVGRLEHL